MTKARFFSRLSFIIRHYTESQQLTTVFMIAPYQNNIEWFMKYKAMDYKKVNCSLNELHNEILELAIQNVGQVRLGQDTFEQISAQQPDKEQDFGFEEQDGQPMQQETQLFRKCIGLGPDKRPSIDPTPPQLRIQGYSFVYGFNNGSKTVELVGNDICRAVGVNLFYKSKIYFQHNQKITFLNYNSSQNILISAAEGKCAEIMLWKCNKQGENYAFEPFFSEKQIKLLNLPLNSLGIGFAWLIDATLLAVITKSNLHQKSILYIFDMATTKRIRCDAKLQKVVQACFDENGSKTILLTQTGLFSLQISLQMQIKLDKIIQEEMITAIQRFVTKDQLHFLVGKLDGTVKLVSEQERNVIFAAKMHQKYVTCVRMIDQSSFLSLGSDKILKIYRISAQMKINCLQTLDIQQICVNALITKSIIYCASKSGKILEFECQNSDKYKKVQKKIDAQMLYSLNQKNALQTWIYDKYSKKYIYSLSDNKEIAAISIDQHRRISSIKRFALAYSPFIIDIVGNIAAYIYRQVKPSKYSESNSSKFSSNQVSAQYLILQDYTIHQLLNEIILDLAGCTKLKLNEDGDKLAVGFENGKVVIFDVNNPKTIVKYKECQHHSKPIEDLIWSKNSKYLKTISKNNLIYYDLQKPGTQISPVFASKLIKDAQWTEIGKFDWKNSNVWQDHLHSVEQITTIKQTKSYQLVIMQSGHLKIFRNPANKKGQEICRFFHNSYHLQLMGDQGNKMNLLVMSEGCMFSVVLRESTDESVFQSEKQADQSFQQIAI